MFEVVVTVNFSSAHQLRGYDGKYENFPVNDDKIMKPSSNLLIQGKGKVICEEFFSGVC